MRPWRRRGVEMTLLNTPQLTLQRAATDLRDALAAVLGNLGAALLAAMLALVLVNVTLRYGFGMAIMGSDDLAIWLHVGLIAVGAPLALASGLAMRFDAVTQHLPPGGASAAQVLADAMTVASALALVFGASLIAGLLGAVSPTVGLPEWIRFALTGVGGGLVLVMLALSRLAEGRGATVLAAIAAGGGIFLAIGAGMGVLSGCSPLAIMAGVAVAGLVAGAPLPHVLILAAYAATLAGGSQPLQAVVANTVGGMSKFLLVAVPFFLLVGALLTASGGAARIVRFAASLVGHWRGGIGQTTLLTGTLFAGASGSSVSEAAFAARTLQPQLVAHGYPPAAAGALVAAVSVLPNVIPPSIAFLILAVATGLSVGALFTAGLFAGLLMAAALAVAIWALTPETSRSARASGSERLASAILALPVAGLGLVILGGIRFGIVTPTEAAALAGAYAIGLTLWLRSGVRPIWSAFRSAATDAAAIGLLIGSAGPVAFLIATDGLGPTLVGAVRDAGLGPLATLLVANAILLAVGLVLDIGAAILLLGPLLVPLAVAVGIDPVTFGAILVVNLMIGGLTPPVGMLVYVVAGVSGLSPTAIFADVVPYLLPLLAALAVLSAWALLN